MAIVSFEDEDDIDEVVLDKTASPIVNTVVPVKNEYETVEIISEDKQLDAVVQYMEGEEWEVDYYLQLITKDNEIGPYDSAAAGPSAQYALIKHMVLFVDTPLSQDSASNVGGSALINAGYIPNQGDIFVATIMGKRTAILRVEKAEKRTYNLKNVFYIEYQVDEFLDSEQTMLKSFNEKVVKTFFYDKEFKDTDSSPLLLETKYKQKISYKDSVRSITDYYFRTMYNEERAMLTIPGQTYTTLDTMLQEFIYKLIDVTDSVYISKINRTTSSDEYLKQPTLWDALIKRDKTLFDACIRKAKPLNTMALNKNIKLRSLSYLGIEYVMYPLDPDLSVSETIDKNHSHLNNDLEQVPNPYRANKGSIENLLPDVTALDGYYIFSKAFYEYDRPNLTVLETIVLNYMNDVKIDHSTLGFILDDYKYWDRVQQYYYIPILLMLLKDAVRNTNSTI